MTAKKCDRCGSYYDEQTKSHLCLKTPCFNGFENIDLCAECLRDLEYWFNIENKKSTDEKQIPKKTILSDEQNMRYAIQYICPSCGKNFSGTGIADYCYHCGQALEWKENKVIIIKQGNINKFEPQNMKHFECYNCGCIYEVEEKDCDHFHIGDSYTSFCPCCHAPNSVD